MMSKHPEILVAGILSDMVVIIIFHPEQMTERDYEWIGRDFYAISFEKSHTVKRGS